MKKKIVSIMILAGIFIVSFALNAICEGASVDDYDLMLIRKHYFEDKLVKEYGLVKEMGWIVFPDKVYSTEKAGKLYLLSSIDNFAEATFEKEISPEELQELRAERWIACDTDKPVYRYRLKGNYRSINEDWEAERVYLTRTQIADGKTSVTKEELKDKGTGIKRLGSAVDDLYIGYRYSVKESKYSYIVEASFEKKTKGVTRAGLFLVREGDKVISKNIEKNSDKEEWCVDCARPEYEQGIRPLHFVYNMITLPGFPFPILLEDTSTVEGRALSLISFDEKGIYKEMRYYEYVATCYKFEHPEGK